MLELTSAMLRLAIADRRCVRVVLRQDGDAQTAAREIEGVPVALDMTRGGVARVTIVIAQGDTEQRVRLDRIAKVVVE